ncbi:hypothetical protein ACDX78_13705 [Virgibacillus oceani]
MISKLMDRVRKLEEWQQQQILVSALFDLDEVDLQGIKEEIEEYEEINKEG